MADEGAETGSESLLLFERVPLQHDISANTLHATGNKCHPELWSSLTFRVKACHVGWETRPSRGGGSGAPPWAHGEPPVLGDLRRPQSEAREAVLTVRLAVQAQRHSRALDDGMGAPGGQSRARPHACPAQHGGCLSLLHRRRLGRRSELRLEPNRPGSNPGSAAPQLGNLRRVTDPLCARFPHL